MNEDKVIFWNRARTIFSWLALLIVLLGLVGGTLAMWELMNVASYVKTMEKMVQERQTPPPVPTEAKETARLFIGTWLSSVDANDSNKKIADLKSFISSDFEQFLTANPNYVVQNGQNLRVFRADSYGEHWVIPNQEARVRVRVLTYDNRTMYFECLVRHSGSAWVVSQLPSLVAAPQRGDDEQLEGITLSDSDKSALQATLDNFMEVWLKGDSEAVRRYTDGVSLPTSNVLPSSTYQGLKSMLPLSNQGDEYTVRVWIGLQDQSKANFTFSYDVKVQKKENEWFVLSVN